jgi:putative peptidoglycan lipid II flippase
MIYAGVSVAVNITGSLSLFFVIGHVGIAIATSLAAWTNAILLGVTLIRRGHFQADASLKKRGGMIVLASVVMGLTLWGASFPLDGLFAPSNGILVQILALLGLVSGGALVYLVLAQLTGALSARALWGAVRRG